MAAERPQRATHKASAKAKHADYSVLSESMPSSYHKNGVNRQDLTNVVYAPIAIMGTSAPKPNAAAPSATFYRFDPPVLNNNGVVAFMASVTGDAPYFAPYRRGLFTGTEGDLHSLGWGGIPIAGVPKNFYKNEKYLHLDDANNIMSVVSFQNGQMTVWQSSTRNSVFSSSSTECRTEQGFAAVNGGVLAGVGFHTVVPARSSRAGNLNTRGVWLWKENKFSFILQSQKTSNTPKTQFGARTETIIDKVEQMELNEQGDIFAITQMLRPDNSKEQSVWFYRNGDLKQVACKGLDAPGIDGNFESFVPRSGCLNSSGQMSFIAKVSRQSPCFGIWVGDASGFRLVATNGFTFSLGLTKAVLNLGANSEVYLLNNGNTVVFDSDGWLWAGTVGTFKRYPVHIDMNEWHAVRPSGMMAFSRRKALWAGELGNWHKIVSVGSSFALPSGENRTVTRFCCGGKPVSNNTRSSNALNTCAGDETIADLDASDSSDSCVTGELLNDMSRDSVSSGKTIRNPVHRGLETTDRSTALPLNDKGQIAFTVVFNNLPGERDEPQGLYLATIPSTPSDGEDFVE